MAVAKHILERPAQFQWDSDSSDKSDNCVPTVIAQIAGFYRDSHVSPDAARVAMTGSKWGGPTNHQQAVAGLLRLGVSSAVEGTEFPSGVRSRLNQGYPLAVMVDYAKIPKNRAYRTDFNFNGWHEVLFCKTDTVNGVQGVWVRDPDHGSPARPERPDKTFWPDSVWVPAFKLATLGRGYVCRPAKLKAAPPPPPPDPRPYSRIVEVTAKPYANIRSTPNATSADVGNLPTGTRIKTILIRAHGGTYMVGTTTRTDWLGFVRNGKTVWIARGYTKLIS